MLLSIITSAICKVITLPFIALARGIRKAFSPNESKRLQGAPEACIPRELELRFHSAIRRSLPKQRSPPLRKEKSPSYLCHEKKERSDAMERRNAEYFERLNKRHNPR